MSRTRIVPCVWKKRSGARPFLGFVRLCKAMLTERLAGYLEAERDRHVLAIEDEQRLQALECSGEVCAPRTDSGHEREPQHV